MRWDGMDGMDGMLGMLGHVRHMTPHTWTVQVIGQPLFVRSSPPDDASLRTCLRCLEAGVLIPALSALSARILKTASHARR
jgi:hypothetical protein